MYVHKVFVLNCCDEQISSHILVYENECTELF